MSQQVRSLSYESHAAIRGRLTNRQIDTYQCQGFYGKERQDSILLAIEEGRFRGLDAKIRKGEVCIEALEALNRRVEKPKRRTLDNTNVTSNSIQNLLKALEVGHF